MLTPMFYALQTDSESPEEGSPGVLLPAADRHGARSRIVSGERHTGNFLVD